MQPGEATGERSISTPIGGEFGTSVEMNTILDVIDFHEKRIRCTHGYPRIVPHRVVIEREAIAASTTGRKFAVAFPSRNQAAFMTGDLVCRAGIDSFVHEAAGATGILQLIHPRTKGKNPDGAGPIVFTSLDGLTFACMDDDGLCEKLRHLRRAWGSAFDVHGLACKPVDPPAGFSKAGLTKRISLLEGGNAAGSLDFQSGMAAVSSLFLAALNERLRIILIGPTYVDTGVIVSRWPSEVPGIRASWLPERSTIGEIDAELEKGPALVFFEAPTNPCLSIPDIPIILESAKKHGAIAGIDSTLATPFNFRPLDCGFDVVVHSTSKFLSGTYRHLGGVVTARSARLLEKISEIREKLDLGMCDNQMHVLYEDLQGFENRMDRINRNAEVVADRLLGSPKVGRVMYPGFGRQRQAELSRAFMSPGRSGLLSFVLKDEGMDALADFYDNVGSPVKKGPGLGGEISLMCPYVMVAHYKADPKHLERLGMHPHLVRLSVGTEPVDDIWHAMRLPL